MVAEAQLFHRGGQAEQRHAAVEVQADHVELLGRQPLLVGDTQADLLEVDRAERPLDGHEPRPVAAAGPQRDRHAGAVVLHRDGGAEAGPRRGAAAAGVVHDALRHRVVAAATAERHPEAAELDLNPAGQFGLPGGAQDDAAEEVHGNGVQPQAGVDQRAAALAEPQPDAVGRDAGRRADVGAVDAEQVEHDAWCRRPAAGLVDPGGVHLEVQRGVAAGQLQAGRVGRRHRDAEQIARLGDLEGERRDLDGRGRGSQLAGHREQLGRPAVEHARQQVRVVGRRGGRFEDRALEHEPDALGAQGRVELGLHHRDAEHPAADEIQHRADGGRGHRGWGLVLVDGRRTRPVRRQHRQPADLPPAGNQLAVVGLGGRLVVQSQSGLGLPACRRVVADPDDGPDDRAVDVDRGRPDRGRPAGQTGAVDG